MYHFDLWWFMQYKKLNLKRGEVRWKFWKFSFYSRWKQIYKLHTSFSLFFISFLLFLPFFVTFWNLKRVRPIPHLPGSDKTSLKFPCKTNPLNIEKKHWKTCRVACMWGVGVGVWVWGVNTTQKGLGLSIHSHSSVMVTSSHIYDRPS